MKIIKIPLQCKQAGLGLHQVQTVRDEFGTEDVLPITSSLIDQYNLKDYFEKDNQSSEYRSFMDFILCTAVPALKKHCDLYYSGEGKKLFQIFPENFIKNVDTSLSKIINKIGKDSKTNV